MKTKNTPRIFGVFSNACTALTLASLATVLYATATAADVNQVADTTTSQGWNSSVIWNGGQVPSAGNDYFTGSFDLRTDNAVTTTFGGRSLTVGTNGQLNLKAYTVNIGSLTLSNGTIFSNDAPRSQVGAVGSVMNVQTLRLVGDNQIHGANNDRPVTLNVQNLEGGGNLVLGKSRPGTPLGGKDNSYYLNVTSSSAFTGSLQVASGKLILDSSLDLRFAAFSVASNPNAFLALGDYNLSVASLSFGDAIPLMDGTYTSAQLNTMFSTNAFSGNGKVIVGAVPEASTTALLFALAAGGLLLGRRVQQKRKG